MKYKSLLMSLWLLAGVTIAAYALQGIKAPSPFEAGDAALTPQQALGKQLFEDTNLSEPRGQSCASCHTPRGAFQGTNGSRIAALARGSRPEHFGNRNVPSLTYAMFAPRFHFAKEVGDDGAVEWVPTGGQFLDGRAADLAAQVEGPLLNANEMNNPSKAAVVEKVKHASYAAAFTQLYGPAAFNDEAKAFTLIATSIAAYESSARFAPFSSKFDRVLAGTDTFSALEAKGFELFKNPEKGNCMACHVGDVKSKKPEDWLFTDHTYDNLGVPRNPHIPENADAGYYDLGLCKQEGIKNHAPKGFELSSLCGAFKVPTLRNVAITAPYGHNGAFTKLRDVVAFYATRDTNPERWYGRNADGSTRLYDDVPEQYHGNVNTSEAPYDRKFGEKPRLDDAEIDALVAFLATLTDEAK